MSDAPLKSGLSGSDKRQRVHVVGVRFLPAEHASVRQRAKEAGLRVGSFLRACALGETGPRAKRSPTVNAGLLGRALADLNRVGNNLNQIAHALNAARSTDGRETASALAELRSLLVQIKEALGRTEKDADDP
jgi:hypothetical protein